MRLHSWLFHWNTEWKSCTQSKIGEWYVLWITADYLFIKNEESQSIVCNDTLEKWFSASVKLLIDIIQCYSSHYAIVLQLWHSSLIQHRGFFMMGWIVYTNGFGRYFYNLFLQSNESNKHVYSHVSNEPNTGLRGFGAVKSNKNIWGGRAVSIYTGKIGYWFCCE